MNHSKKMLLLPALLLACLVSFNSCKKNGGATSGDCDKFDAAITKDEAAYNNAPTIQGCKLVEGDYNEYINNDCPDADSYVNTRDAFLKAHNQCQ